MSSLQIAECVLKSPQVVDVPSNDKGDEKENGVPGIPKDKVLEKAAEPNSKILPHSNNLDEEEVRYIGGIYDKTIHRSNWKIHDLTQMPYLEYLKSIAEEWPHITWLADYMEVGTSPIKWKFLTEKNIKERAEKTKVAVLEFSKSGDEPMRKDFHLIGRLRDYVNETTDPEYARLFIVEDLSRDVIEILGAKYDIDPLYFRSQISDYMWYNTTDPWAELDDLPHIARERNYYNIRYMRARYFESYDHLDHAKKELGGWNVLRRMEQELGWRARNKLQKERALTDSTVGLLRSKTALWISQTKDDKKGIIGVLVCDPTLAGGYPLWEGPRNLNPCPSMHAQDRRSRERPKSVFEEACHYSVTMDPEHIKAIEREPRALGIPIISLVASEWMTVTNYLVTSFTKMESQLESPEYREKRVEELLDQLNPLRRPIPVYRKMVAETLNAIFDVENEDPERLGDTNNVQHLSKLRMDFEHILKTIDQLQIRSQNIVSLVTTTIGVEETKRAIRMNQHMVSLTYVAVLFAPMAFISSLFSMNANIGDLKHTTWIYFVVAIPVTSICLFVTLYFKRMKQNLKKKGGREVKGNQIESQKSLKRSMTSNN
ncbi:hypothetical protein HYFRA_00001692 [Hymenoscyphus fraxineus]|uniref:Uncharacterized protein n=1 Tax=Hymenoscyphus fraxineus TaxID=746836 RepID=A0A9N9L3U6_9HELO|nr:hypothetical protein HYFRA_00001692 [Hymenoscyphus fraxineus]